MFHADLPTPELNSSEFSELKRDDLVLAIECARAVGFYSSEKALLELLSVLDDILGVGGQIKYRVSAELNIQSQQDGRHRTLGEGRLK